MQFPLDTVREVAHILQSQNLGEITLQTAGGKLTLKRPAFAAPTPLPLEDDAAIVTASSVLDSETPQPEVTEPIVVVSPAVGVFREAKKPLQVGDEVVKKAVLGTVETLNIPTELVAPQAARVSEIRIIDGQGVEWGQTLLVLEPLETPTA